MKSIKYVAGLGVVLLVTAACSSATEGVTVEDPWGRTSPMAAANAAFYVTLTGGEADDVLIAADSDACAIVELHETVMNDGVMQMQHLPDGFALSAGDTVALEPGGKHIMCIDKNTEFVAGETLSVTLSFETAEDMVVDFEIRDE